MQLVNKAAFCYIIKPSKEQRECDGFVTDQWYLVSTTQAMRITRAGRWQTQEAMNLWLELRPEESSNDDRLPFAPVRVPQEDSLRWQNCLELGLTGSISEKSNSIASPSGTVVSAT